MLVPSVVMILGEVVHVALAPFLIFGWGPFPTLGVAGAAIALVSTLTLRALVLLAYMVSGRGQVTPLLRGARLSSTSFWEILRVGLPGVANTVLTNGYVMLLTGLVGAFGTASLAGYGLGARLEYLQIPLVFGLGAGLVTMVGMNVGAGQVERAKRVAWFGAALAAAITGSIGMLGAIAPSAWLGLFTADSDVLAVGTSYLHLVGPTYAFFGLGLALYFASQGAGQLFWPLMAGVIRLVIAAGGGWIAVHWLGAGPLGIFVAAAIAVTLYGLIVALAVWAGAWDRAVPRPR
jgi:Na+-driven multidrug efflux pump